MTGSVVIKAVVPIAAQGEPAVNKEIWRIRQHVCQMRFASQTGRGCEGRLVQETHCDCSLLSDG